MNNSALQSDTSCVLRNILPSISQYTLSSLLIADESLIVGGGSLRVLSWPYVHWPPLSAAGPGPELVLYTLPQLTPVTGCDQQQVLPILRSALTNHGPVLPQTDQSGARTAVLYIWVPYGHASHRMILATFIFLELMNEFKRTQQFSEIHRHTFARVVAHCIIETAQVINIKTLSVHYWRVYIIPIEENTRAAFCIILSTL